MPRLLLLTLASMIAIQAPNFSQATQNPAEIPAQPMQSLKVFLQRFDADLKDQFVAGFADLNGDGRLEAVVYLTSSGWCGSGGCTTLVLVRDADSWRLLTKITVTRPPIRVLSKKSKGWRNLGVWVQGGGVQPGYEAELQFDGKTYPANPSMNWGRRATRNADGKTLIAPTTAILSPDDDTAWKSVWSDWRSEVRRQCPSHHIEWIADGGYDALVDGFAQTLPLATQEKIAQIADYSYRCSYEQAGFSCEMAVHLDAFIRLGLLKQFASYGCGHWKCVEPAVCTRSSR